MVICGERLDYLPAMLAVCTLMHMLRVGTNTHQLLSHPAEEWGVDERLVASLEDVY